MPEANLISLVTGAGGAVVALLLWIWDLRKQRDQEREERIKNAEVMATVGSALGELTTEIGPLVELLPELLEIIDTPRSRSTARERRR